MAYSEVNDLLLGDLRLGAGVDPQQFVDAAADEIDSKLGWLYVTPIELNGNLAGLPPLPRHEQLLLKGINNKLASGRLILTIAIAGEDKSLHAYGARLVKDATDELLMVANGRVDLSAPRQAPNATEADRTPTVVNEDSESLLLGFVNTVHRNRPWRTQPGDAEEPYAVPWFGRREAGG